MNPTIISVPAVSGAQGAAIQDYVLDRVSGDVQKNLGNVVEDAFQGSSVPCAALVILDAVEQIRRVYVCAASTLSSGLVHATEATRATNIQTFLANLIGGEATPTFAKLTVVDPASKLKSKNWAVSGLTQTASTSGTSGLTLLDELLAPSLKALSLAGIIAKLEDVALQNDQVAIFVNQNFPELLFSRVTGGELDLPELDSQMNDMLAQVNAQFVAASSDSNPSFGFESGAGF